MTVPIRLLAKAVKDMKMVKHVRYTCYDATRSNLKLSSDTKVICQGFTGKEATFHCRRTIEYGTNLVGGVSLYKGVKVHLGLPVFHSVKEAKDATDCEATVIYVPPLRAADAILEAMDAAIPLVVCVSEGILHHDMIKIKHRLVHQTKTRLLGPNCPGIIAPGQCKIGKMPGHIHQRGIVGVVSSSAILIYVAVQQTTKIGLGQSLCVGIGDDAFSGTNFVDCLELFLQDPDTKGIILIGETGSIAEENVAGYLMENNAGPNAKPVVAFVAEKLPARKTMVPTKFISGDKQSVKKIDALKKAGVIVTKSPAQMGSDLLKEMKRLGIV